MEHATKSASDQHCRRAASGCSAPAGADRTVVDKRLEAFAQRDLTEGADNASDVLARQAAISDISISPRIIAQRRQFSRMFGPVLQRGAELARKQPVPPIQRKEEADLKRGVFNMIGETHKDYPDDHFRDYESRQIRVKLGEKNRYVTEGQLKTLESHDDFSDPLDLRVEQLVAFLATTGPDLVSRLKSINLDLVTTRQKDANAAQTALEIVKSLIPRLKLAATEFPLQRTLDELSDKSAAVLNILKESAVWDEVEDESDDDDDAVSTEDDENTALTPVTVAPLSNFSINAIKVQHGISTSLGPKDKTDEEKETERAFECFRNAERVYELYKDRLPGTLQQYYQLKSTAIYSTHGKYNFSLHAIPFILDDWGLLDKLVKRLRDKLYSKDFGDDAVDLKDFIKSAALIFGDVADGLLAGAQGNTINVIAQVTEKRSRKMHEAAQALAEADIAWKVGELHIKDIKRLEDSGDIADTKYAYITKENFKEKNFNEADAKEYARLAQIAANSARQGKTGQVVETSDPTGDLIKGHRDGLNADESVHGSEHYRRGYQQGQQQLEEEIKSLQASRVIQRWLRNARTANKWDKMRTLCKSAEGKGAAQRAGLSMSDVENMEPDFKGTIEEWLLK